MPMCGGTSPSKPADPEIQGICEKVKVHVESKSGKSYVEFTAISYSSQVVAGTNYFVKIHVGDGDHVHARIYQPLPGQGDISVHSIQEGKSAADAIEYF